MSSLLQPYNERMMRVLLYIQQNLDGDLSPETLAEQACFSVVHFHRIFKGMIGENLKEHVRRLRLERAAYKLCYTELSVMDIALEAGFESSETFSRAFKKRFHLSPSAFRDNTRTMFIPGNTDTIHYTPQPDIKNFRLDNAANDGKVEIRTRPETHLAFIRHIGSYFSVTKAWEKLCGWGFENGLLSTETEFLGLCYDDPDITPQEKIRYDACFSISHEIETPSGIGTQILPGGKFAVTTHYGPYEELHSAYKDLYGKWLPGSAYQPRDVVPSFEKYIKAPPDVPSKEAVTELWLAVY